jgi:hypothetical protein
MMKNKIISGLLLAFSLSGGASRALAQGQPLPHISGWDSLVRLTALDLETNPTYARSVYFKSLPPDVQRAAIARAKEDKETSRATQCLETKPDCVKSEWFKGLPDDVQVAARARECSVMFVSDPTTVPLSAEEKAICPGYTDAVYGLLADPAYAKSAKFKALRPDVQGAALALVREKMRPYERAKLKAEAESWAVFVCVVGGVLWLVAAVVVRLLARFGKERGRSGSEWNGGEEVVSVVVEAAPDSEGSQLLIEWQDVEEEER